MDTTVKAIFLPSLGMAWRGMWSLAYVPVLSDETDEETASAA